MYISTHTVAHHLRQAFRKLTIASRVELTRIVIEQTADRLLVLIASRDRAEAGRPRPAGDGGACPGDERRDDVSGQGRDDPELSAGTWSPADPGSFRFGYHRRRSNLRDMQRDRPGR